MRKFYSLAIAIISALFMAVSCCPSNTPQQSNTYSDSDDWTRTVPQTPAKHTRPLRWRDCVIVEGSTLEMYVIAFNYNGHEYLMTSNFIYHSESCPCKNKTVENFHGF